MTYATTPEPELPENDLIAEGEEYPEYFQHPPKEIKTEYNNDFYCPSQAGARFSTPRTKTISHTVHENQ